MRGAPLLRGGCRPILPPWSRCCLLFRCMGPLQCVLRTLLPSAIMACLVAN